MSEGDEPLAELAEELFRAGRAEPSPSGEPARAMAALGIEEPPAGPARGGESGDGSTSGAGNATSTWPALKGLGLTVLSSVLALGAWHAIPSAPPPPSAAPSTAATTSAPAPSVSSPSAVAPRDPAPMMAVREVPSIAPTPSAPARAPTRGGPRSETAPVAPSSASTSMLALPPPSAAGPSNGPDGLAAELTLLERARVRIRANDALGALVELDRYAADHPRGALSAEALLLRVEALVVAGRREEARRAAAPLLERPAGDLHGDRARALLAR